MKKLTTLCATTLFSLSLAMGAQAATMNHGDHAMDHGTGQATNGIDDGHGQPGLHHDTAMEHGADHAGGHQGEPIRQTTVDGYQLHYELIDMESQARAGGHPMPAEMKSHHLMLHLTDARGRTVTEAKTGYLVTGPDGEQKAMAMFMSGGYGADVDLKPAGSYTVKTKVVTPDGKKLLDDFTYEVK